jgi:glyoxylase-like metal-dependent hydrolase (beta-lactamase superfamily II)
VASSLYFRQLLSGRDFAVDDPMASQMVNFVYLIGDRQTGEAMVVDPAYRVSDLLGVAEADGMHVVGALVTHHHPDHVGGSFMGHRVEGVHDLLEVVQVPVHAHKEEADFVRRTADIGGGDVVSHDSGDIVSVGSVDIQLLHTPGHTPGSQCFLVAGRLVAGDTLFLEGCGRTDLPGSDPDAMFDSLHHLASLPDDVVVYPGHRYSLASIGTLGAIKEVNSVLKPSTREEWRSIFGA